MKTLHAPRKGLCKKLKEIGFPATALSYFKDFEGNEFICEHHEYFQEDFIGPCPSVMEMLDIIKFMEFSDHYECPISISYVCENVYSVHYEKGPNKYFQGTLPNALAEMILWLAENKYLSFK